MSKGNQSRWPELHGLIRVHAGVLFGTFPLRRAGFQSGNTPLVEPLDVNFD